MGDLFVLNGTKSSWAIPGFTSSFIFTTWAMMYASKRYGHDIWPAPPPPPKEELIAGSGNQATNDNFKWTAKEFIIATLKGVSQVTFVENWKTGIFWVVGLTLSFELAPLIAGQARPWFTNGYTAQWNEFSPLYLGGLMALIGSAVGLALAILTKLPTAEIRLGLHGFNQVLVMIALTSFLPLTPQSFMMALTSYSCVFSNSNAGFAKIFWNVGTACSNRTFRIYSMGVSARNFGFLTYSRRNWLVKTSPIAKKVAQNTQHTTSFFLLIR